MQSLTFVLFAALVTVAYAGGQFYVPRAYFTIDSDGHESVPVPLRRLRRSVQSYPPLGVPRPSDNTVAVNINGRDPYQQPYPHPYPIPYKIPVDQPIYDPPVPIGSGIGASNPNLPK